MKIEEFETTKFIYPQNDWRCWICLKEMRNLEAFAETEKEVCLICEPCYERNLRMVKFDLAEL